MPVVIWRGQEYWFSRQDLLDPTGEEYSRKGIEKAVRKLLREQQELEASLPEQVDGEIKEGDFTVFLDVSARRRRGRAMKHCLGSAVGGPRQPYIAVGKNQDTVGYKLDSGVLRDQAHGYADGPHSLTVADLAEADRLAAKYAGRASWGSEGKENPEDAKEERLAEIIQEIAFWRRLEFVRAFYDGRAAPGVLFDSVGACGRYSLSVAAEGEKAVKLVNLAREFGFTTQRTAYTDYRVDRYNRGYWPRVCLYFVKVNDLHPLVEVWEAALKDEGFEPHWQEN